MKFTYKFSYEISSQKSQKSETEILQTFSFFDHVGSAFILGRATFILAGAITDSRKELL